MQHQHPTKPESAQGEHTFELDPAVFFSSGRELAEHLIACFKAPGYEPPMLPRVALKINEIVYREDTTAHTIVSLLEEDPMLMAKVLQIVRSPLYSGGRDVWSLRDAVVRIGQRTVAEVVMQASMNTRIMRHDLYREMMTRIYRHCTVTAHFSKLACRYAGAHGDYAFMCGLLHDIGIAAILLGLSNVNTDGTTHLEMMWGAIHDCHAEASQIMCQMWELPEDIQRVARAHHCVFIDGEPSVLAAAVCLAEDMAHERGVTIPSPLDHLGADVMGHASFDRTPGAVLEQARDVLGLSDVQWAKLNAEADDLLDMLPVD